MIHKTLSEKQPWSYLLCAGIKDIENRTWPLPEKYRDEWVLIHAGADRKLDLTALTREQYLIASEILNEKCLLPLVPVCEWTRSAITGAVKFTDCVINHPSIWAEKVDNTDRVFLGLKPIYNWVVSDAILFDNPIMNVKGRLSFWNFDLPEEYAKLLK